MMATKDPAGSTCPIGYALEIFGDRWTLLVLRDLMLNSRRRYKELLACPEGIATNVLADRLKRLEQRGLISKLRDPLDARQFIYTPTEAAIGLIPMLSELIVWSARNGVGDFDEELVQRISKDRERFILETQDAIRRSVDTK
jgi:DNA-binding HxlR family transcriptional regulator